MPCLFCNAVSQALTPTLEQLVEVRLLSSKWYRLMLWPAGVRMSVPRSKAQEWVAEGSAIAIDGSVS